MAAALPAVAVGSVVVALVLQVHQLSQTPNVHVHPPDTRFGNGLWCHVSIRNTAITDGEALIEWNEGIGDPTESNDREAPHTSRRRCGPFGCGHFLHFSDRWPTVIRAF